MRRTLVPIYALVLLETLVWIAIVPLAPTFAAELHLSPVETGMILAAATTVSGVGFTVGPVFAGTLADRSDTGTPFLLVAVAAAAVTGALVVAAPAATWHSTHEHLPDVLRAAGRDKLVLAAIVIIALIGLVGGGVNLLVPLRLRANGVSAG